MIGFFKGSMKRSGEGVARRARVALLLGLAVLAGACDNGPSGPGELDGVLEASGVSFGGVALEVVGTGIEGFSGAGGTRVLWAATDVANTYRVVAINQVAGSVRFQVSVQDLGADKPRATIVSLVDGSNAALEITNAYQVTFTR